VSRLIQLDGRECEVEPGESLLHAARRHLGMDSVPTLCDAPDLRPGGSCRLCIVEVASTADGTRRVVASCHTAAEAGQFVWTASPRLQRLRKTLVELVLSDHPPDGGLIASDGFNELQRVSAQLAPDRARFAGGRTHGNLRPDTSHVYMRADLSKCINCYRCVRACDQVQGEFVLGTHGRGFDARIIMGADTTFAQSPCVSCGACAQTCPTGAISDVQRTRIAAADTPPVRTVCTYCGVGCSLEVYTHGGEVVAIDAPWDAEVNRGHLCLKGRYAWGFYNHPDRLHTPLIRRGGQLEPATWDDALSLMAAQFTAIRAEHGPDAIGAIMSARCPNEENYLMQKFMRAVIGTNNVDGCARVCHAPTAYGLQQAFGTGAATNSIEEIPLADLILIAGANPTQAHPVTGAKIKQAALRGTPLIVIDPMRIELAALATWHLQIRPGTNVALLLLFAREILDAGLVNESFVRARCENFEELRSGLLAQDPDALARITGVPRALVREAAVAYARAPRAMAFHGLGVTEHSQGSKGVMLLANLALMTGHLGRPGTGINPLRGQNNVQGAADMGVQPHQGPGYLDLTDASALAHYARIYGVPVPAARGRTIPEMLEGARDGLVTALWIVGEDVAQTDPDTSEVLKALGRLDFLVVQELFMTKTAQRAHVVLPAASFLEKNGTFTNGERRIQRVNRAVAPVPGTRPDGEIIVEMMNRMGYPQPPYDSAQLWREIGRAAPPFAGVTWERLGENGKQWPVDQSGMDTKILHTKSFTRGRGRFHFFPFVKSRELTEHETDYPFVLTTGRRLVHYNCGAMTRRTPDKDLVAADALYVHPEDARRKGVGDGDPVRVFSARAGIHLPAKISTEVPEGVLFTTFHFPDELVNLLTSDELDPESLCPEYKVVAVDFCKDATVVV
jgi:formate dehydrogenase major subunit